MTSTKKLSDMTRAEKLDHLQGKWTEVGLDRKIAECNFKRSTEKTRQLLISFFVKGMTQVDIAEKFSISRQGVSNTLARFIIRLYESK